MWLSSTKFFVIFWYPRCFSNFKKNVFWSFAVFISVAFAPNLYVFCDVVTNYNLFNLTLLYLLTLSSSKFLSFFFTWFSKFVFCCCFALATCFLYRIVNFLASYFKSSHFSWWLKRDSFLEQNLRISFLIVVLIFS